MKKRNKLITERMVAYWVNTLSNFNINREDLEECIVKYNEFNEQICRNFKQFKAVNLMLSSISFENKDFLTMADLDAVIQDSKNKLLPKYDFHTELCTNIKDECISIKNYFTIGDVPELIVRKRISRKDYEDKVLKLLQKVKKIYLKQKI